MDSMETVIKKENQKVLNTGSISTPSWSNCQKKDNSSFGDNWFSWRVVYKANATKKEDTVIKKTTLARQIRRGHSSTQYKLLFWNKNYWTQTAQTDFSIKWSILTPTLTYSKVTIV